VRPLPGGDVPDARGLALPRLRVQDRLLRLVTDADLIERWIAALLARHTASLRTPEFLKAVRALSARYVERRRELPHRLPADSAGKRAAFAGFFAPLHFLIAHTVATELRLASAGMTGLVDLGCGTGIAGAACGLAAGGHTALVGVDRQAWALGEAAWNWRYLGLRGRTIRADLVEHVLKLSQAAAGTDAGRPLLVFGWSVNELDRDARAQLLAAVVTLVARGAGVLVLEPIARSVTPWWADWARALVGANAAPAGRGERQDEWRLTPQVPEPLRSMDAAAGFHRDELTARSLYVPSR
jgi:hypothetical protein